MLDLEKNKQTVYYALYEDKVPIIDDDGHDTGETKVQYSKPTKLRICVSTGKGSAENDVFGKDISYDKVMSTCSKLPINEYSVLWVDVEPNLDDTGAISTPHDYIVKRVAKSLNSTMYAIERV